MLYDLENRVFFVSRDVVFMESIFPLRASVKDQDNQTMPHNHFSYDDLTINSDITDMIDPIIIPPTITTDEMTSVTSSLPEVSQITLMENKENTDDARPMNNTKIRRSVRGSKPSIWHRDYVVQLGSKSYLYSITDNIDYNGLSAKYQSFVSKFLEETDWYIMKKETD